MKDIGEKIKQIRKSKGISLKALSTKVNLSDTALSHIETGKVKSITIDLGQRIAAAFNVPFTELFEIENKTSNSKLQSNQQHLRPEISPESIVAIKVIRDDFIRAQLEFASWTKSFDDLVIEIISIHQQFDGPYLNISIIYWIP